MKVTSPVFASLALCLGLVAVSHAELVTWTAQGTVTDHLEFGVPPTDNISVKTGDDFKITFVSDTSIAAYQAFSDAAYFNEISGTITIGDFSGAFDAPIRLYIGDNPPAHTYILDATSGEYGISMLLSGQSPKETGLDQPTEIQDLDAYDIIKEIHFYHNVSGGGWTDIGKIETLTLSSNGAVPEPVTYGFGGTTILLAGVAMVRRRRRTQPTT